MGATQAIVQELRNSGIAVIGQVLYISLFLKPPTISEWTVLYHHKKRQIRVIGKV
jgi:hypothetical protein